MDARKVGLVGGATLIGAGVLAARSLGPKMHEHCKTMQADMCGRGEASRSEPPSEHECSPAAACAARTNAEEVS